MFTIFGASGFIGGYLARHLARQGYKVNTPTRDSLPNKKNLGHVIYCIGMTGNFREDFSGAVDSHVMTLQRLMDNNEYCSWLYLSSTRVYGGGDAESVANETSEIFVRPGGDAIYDISKLLGESVCLAKKNSSVRVVRLSNVYGLGQSKFTFLGSIVEDLLTRGESIVHESPDSEKDYVSVHDVVELLPKISLYGKERIYNVASGRNTSHESLVRCVEGVFGGRVYFSPGAKKRAFPLIGIERCLGEFDFFPRSVADGLDFY
ncbi:NAD-dependent epimerase/dehydratase family protein [Bisbaumannia pacifica]|uniref:NAD(P)-dependent oxidoreductase n=1 Tax=Bisbaumannia pacifica TaxID=77098 RepID=A0ABD4L2S7_9GAMM|nr:NAD(P)-dependent oxidoreductase [Halomonas pacifica]MBH8579864.1 NAD(P)-dependent oxidoreductase [Halomonas pacifica]